MKTFAYILIGAVLMFVVLKFLSTKPVVTPSETSENFKKLMSTPEAVILISSDQFANLLLTPEFKKLAKGISDEYIRTITKSILT